MSEVVFSTLPLVVIASAVAYWGELEKLITTPEWPFGAAVLLGQAVARVAAGASRMRADASRVTLAVSVLVVLGLVPALLLLVASLAADRSGHAPVGGREIFFHVLGVVWYVGAAAVFVVLGAATETGPHERPAGDPAGPTPGDR